MTTLPLLNWVLLSTVCLGCCWLLYRVALQHEAFFGYNRTLLLLAPLVAAVLPLLPVPALWHAPTQATSLATAAAWLPEVRIGASSTPNAATWPMVWLLYGAGAVLMLISSGWRLGRLWYVTRNLPAERHPGYTLRYTGGRLPTCSFGSTIYWDETAPLTSAEATQMLQHELAHVRQGHSADRMWLEVWRAVLWFNPFVYLHAQALVLTHEYLADAAVVREAAAAGSYSALLARQAISHLPVASSPTLAHAFATPHSLKRIAMLEHSTIIRRWKQWLALPIAAILFVIVACDKTPKPADSPTAEFDFSKVQPVQAPPAPAADSVVLDQADALPEYPGGLEKLMQDLTTNIKYPKSAKEAGWQGRVFVSFVVGSDGYVREARIEKKPQPTATASNGEMAEVEVATLLAMQAISQRWKPAEKNGKPVAMKMTVPVVFQL